MWEGEGRIGLERVWRAKVGRITDETNKTNETLAPPSPACSTRVPTQPASVGPRGRQSGQKGRDCQSARGGDA